jgi:hypothetical protein
MSTVYVIIFVVENRNRYREKAEALTAGQEHIIDAGDEKLECGLSAQKYF